MTFDAAEYGRTGQLKIANIVPSGPAALSGVTAGQYLVAVDSTPVSRSLNLDALLEYKLDKEVTLTLSDRADGSNPKEVKVMTVSAGTERTLNYRQWVRTNRQYVKNISNGRLGYVHNCRHERAGAGAA